MMSPGGDKAKCPACENSGGKEYIIREMMFGTGEAYHYTECAQCGSLYLTDDLAGLESKARFYAGDYYSFRRGMPRSFSLMRRLVRRTRFKAYLWNKGFAGKILERVAPAASQYPWLKECRLRSFADTILDVGCGNGDTLLYLRRAGFKNLRGIDPFVEADLNLEGVRISKSTLFEVNEQFDCIMFHHSFEHLERPREVLCTARDLLHRGGTICIRVPVKDSPAWQTYGIYWVQLDAPRHLFIPTTAAIGQMAASAGLDIVHSSCDSTAFQFWGSEQYTRGIPLYSPRSFVVDPAQSCFTARQIEDFTRQAGELNRAGQGDQRCFILAPGPGSP